MSQPIPLQSGLFSDRVLGLLSCTLLGAAMSSDLAVAQSGSDAPTAPPGLLDLQRQVDELSARLDATPGLKSSRASMKIFGRIHLDSWTFAESDSGINVLENGDPGRDPENGLEFRRARMGMSGAIDESMFYKMEFEFGHPDSVKFKDVKFGFKDVPHIKTLTIGNQKRPYGLDALNSSNPNIFIERPFIVAALNQNARRLGVVAGGVDEDLDWNWRYGAFNTSDWTRTGSIDNDRFYPEFAGRLANTFHWEDKGRKYGHWAVSGSAVFPDGDPTGGDNSNEARFRTRPESRTGSRWIDTSRISGTNHYELIGLESVWNDGPLNLTAEYMNAWVSRGEEGPDLGFNGGYVQAAYMLTGEFMPWNRKIGTIKGPKPSTNLGPGSGAWQIAARYSFADFTNKDVLGGRGESLTLGLNWYWNANASLQFNYIRGEISGRDESAGGLTYSGGDYEILGMRMRIEF